jgi:hypothetical protein
MELEKGTILPQGDPLDLEEGELREDADAATIPTTGALTFYYVFNSASIILIN